MCDSPIFNIFFKTECSAFIHFLIKRGGGGLSVFKITHETQNNKTLLVAITSGKQMELRGVDGW